MDKYTTPDLTSSALITIDTQCDTLDGQPLEVQGTSDVLPSVKMLLDMFRELSKPIIHIVRIYKKNGSNVDLCRKSAVECGQSVLLENSPGCDIAPDLMPNPAITLDCRLLLSGGIQRLSPLEVIMYKPRWGAFYKTPLEAYLKKLQVNTLIFIGCNFPNCPRTSIYEASERDYRIVLVTDAVSGLYDRGKKEMENIGVKLYKARKLLEELQSLSTDASLASSQG
jgi:nicotinamidase-related amidase